MLIITGSWLVHLLLGQQVFNLATKAVTIVLSLLLVMLVSTGSGCIDAILFFGSLGTHSLARGLNDFGGQVVGAGSRNSHRRILTVIYFGTHSKNENTKI